MFMAVCMSVCWLTLNR